MSQLRLLVARRSIKSHQRKRIMRSVAQTALLKFLTKRVAEGQAVGPIHIVIGKKIA